MAHNNNTWMATTTTMTSTLLLLLLVHLRPASAVTCEDIKAGLEPCVTAMTTLPVAAPAACCAGLKAIVDLEADFGVTATCKCTKALLATPFGISVSFNVSVGIQSLCTVDLGYNFNSDFVCGA
ncbi:hypothetical protein QJS04_geneDACA021100 [Acorus gramineus]|uniref:Bifunctional inhibitor/plant lipid transfer protein/seed storage helical domain-containing protein n=1 Tax=Acorus gramineus TaxID=55184 RepID=A0AAV9A0P2_ACOGR|nr:hypothetical protein QJS04_geneDACA021100 [Acorus gramineus]